MPDTMHIQLLRRNGRLIRTCRAVNKGEPMRIIEAMKNGRGSHQRDDDLRMSREYFFPFCCRIHFQLKEEIRWQKLGKYRGTLAQKMKVENFARQNHG